MILHAVLGYQWIVTIKHQLIEMSRYVFLLGDDNHIQRWCSSIFESIQDLFCFIQFNTYYNCVRNNRTLICNIEK